VRVTLTRYSLGFLTKNRTALIHLIYFYSWFFNEWNPNLYYYLMNYRLFNLSCWTNSHGMVRKPGNNLSLVYTTLLHIFLTLCHLLLLFFFNIMIINQLQIFLFIKFLSIFKRSFIKNLQPQNFKLKLFLFLLLLGKGESRIEKYSDLNNTLHSLMN